MKLIIDIPEGLFEAYKGRPPRLGDEGMDMIAQAIANGTPIKNGIPYEERPQGKWINQTQGAKYPCECSECHAEPFCNDEGYVLSDFCSNCGADMRGGRE